MTVVLKLYTRQEFYRLVPEAPHVLEYAPGTFVRVSMYEEDEFRSVIFPLGLVVWCDERRHLSVFKSNTNVLDITVSDDRRRRKPDDLCFAVLWSSDPNV